MNSLVWLEIRYIMLFSSISRVRLSGWEVQGYRWNEKWFWKVCLHQNQVALYYLLKQRFVITWPFLTIKSDYTGNHAIHTFRVLYLRLIIKNLKTHHIFCRNFLDDAELQKVKEVLEHNQEITKHSYGVGSVRNSPARMYMLT